MIENSNTKKAVNDMMERLGNESVEEIQDYDVKDEFSHAENVLVEQDAIKKILLYKEEAPKKNFDCDVTLRSVVIFQLAWQSLRDSSEIVLQKNYNANRFKYEIKTGELTLRGDTLQSFWTTYKDALRKLTPNYWEICSEAKITQLKDGIISNYEKFSLGRLHGLFNRWAEVSHSVGAFLPVPKGVNQARYKMTLDYWDLMMYVIYLWYHDKKDYLKEVLGSSTDVCEKWLMQFKDEDGSYSWNAFVEQNYLQDFVSEKDGRPIEFFPNHFKRFELLLKIWKGDSPSSQSVGEFLIPRNETQLEHFLESVIEATEKRGKRIAKEVKNALKNDM